jgi:hypothetical protein
MKTAVDIFIEKLEEHLSRSYGHAQEHITIEMDISSYMELKESAKREERQHIEDAFDQGAESHWNMEKTGISSEYYTQTYEQ